MKAKVFDELIEKLAAVTTEEYFRKRMLRYRDIPIHPKDTVTVNINHSIRFSYNREEELELDDDILGS